MAMATKYKLNNRNLYNSNSKSEIKDVLEATCIISKWFIRCLYFKEKYAIYINLVDFLFCWKSTIKLIFDIYQYMLKIQNKYYYLNQRFITII